MDIKHFHYISKSKVEAITGQIPPQFHWSKINPKLQGFGFGIDLNFEREKSTSETEELVKKTIAMIDYLKKKRLAIPVQGKGKIDEAKLYYDDSEWFHGLYSLQFESFTKKQFLTYILWKEVEKSVFFLLGSPLNVLGNRDVQVGEKYEQSSSQILGGILEEAITNSFVEVLQNKQLQSFNERVYVDLNADDHPDFKINVQSWVHSKRIRAKVNVFRGTALAVFCHEALALLPRRKIDTIFRIHQTMPVSRAVIPYDVLYLGSPIYTAHQ